MEKNCPLRSNSGSVRAPSGFFLGKSLAAKPWGLGAAPHRIYSLEFALGKSLGSHHTAPEQIVSTLDILLRGQFFPHCPLDFHQLFLDCLPIVANT